MDPEAIKTEIMRHVAKIVKERDDALADAKHLRQKLADTWDDMDADFDILIKDRDDALDKLDDVREDLRDAEDEISALSRMLRRADRDIEGLALDLRDAERYVCRLKDLVDAEGTEVTGDSESLEDSESLADSESPRIKRRRVVIDSDSE